MNRQYSVEMLEISAHRMLDDMFSLQFQYAEYVQDSNYCDYCELNILRLSFIYFSFRLMKNKLKKKLPNHITEHNPNPKP